MSPKSVVIFSIVCSLAVLFPPECSAAVLGWGMGPVGILHWGTKGVMAGIHNSIMIGKTAGAGVVAGAKKVGASALLLPAIGAKKAFLLAPITIPLAIGGKALLAAKLAVPMGIGAAVGAPVGALIGAKAGALKGALIGKAIIAAKIALAKKAAVKVTALALKPVVLVAGAKAKLGAVGLGLLGKGVLAAGAVATKAGAGLKSASTKLNGFTSNIAQSLTLPKLTLPELPALPVKSATKKGPTAIEYSFVVNGPHTGYKSKKASFYSSNRKRREASPEAAPEPNPANAQQLLQLVRSQNAQQCLQRVICELTANPNSHGTEGVRFGRSLILLESQTDRQSAAQYRQAANTGSQIQSGQMCNQYFPTCAFQSDEIIRIGNQMIQGH